MRKRFSFSEDTRRNIGIVIGAGVIIALIAGGMAIHERIFGGAEVAGSSTASSLAVPEGPVQTEVQEWFEDDLGNLGHPYPSGGTAPQVVDLLPQVQGATFVSADSVMMTVEVPSAYVEPDAEPGSMTYVVYRRGDIAALEALEWRCQWAGAYVDAEEAGDTAAATQAREALESFSDLEAVQGLPVARENESELQPVLDGDLEAGREWLAAKCGA